MTRDHDRFATGVIVGFIALVLGLLLWAAWAQNKHEVGLIQSGLCKVVDERLYHPSTRFTYDSKGRMTSAYTPPSYWESRWDCPSTGDAFWRRR